MKRGIIVFLATISLLVSGCQGFGGAQKEPQLGYRTGSQGLVINFLPSYPRTQMYDSDPFDVIIEIRNRGSADVGFGGDAVYLSGYDPGIITGISTFGENVPAGLEGASEFNVEGGYDTIAFNAQIFPLRSKNIDRYPFTILASACYGYETIASENVCIDPDPFSATAEKKVCTPAPVSFGTQGAPIAVSSVEVDATPRVTRFKIHITNVGGGTVFKQGGDYLQKCSPYHSRGLEFNEVDQVRLRGVNVAGKTITSSCKPMDPQDGSVKLINGRGTVFCELGGMPIGPAFNTPLTIELDYGYRNTISRSVEVLRTP